MSIKTVSEGAPLFIQIQIKENDNNGKQIHSIGLTDEKTPGWENRFLMKLAHAIGLDDATSITVNTD